MSSFALFQHQDSKSQKGGGGGRGHKYAMSRMKSHCIARNIAQLVFVIANLFCNLCWRPSASLTPGKMTAQAL